MTWGRGRMNKTRKGGTPTLQNCIMEKNKRNTVHSHVLSLNTSSWMTGKGLILNNNGTGVKTAQATWCDACAAIRKALNTNASKFSA